jgi:hypothetical protein
VGNEEECDEGRECMEHMAFSDMASGDREGIVEKESKNVAWLG